LALRQVRALQLVFTVCGSNQSALRQSQQFLAEFESLCREVSKAELPAHPFLHAFKARSPLTPVFLWKEVSELKDGLVEDVRINISAASTVDWHI